MFTTESVVAKTWANAVIEGEKTLEEVPNLSNLRVIVSEIMEEAETNV